MKLKSATLALGMVAVLVGCGQAKKHEKVINAEEFKDVKAPEYFLVKASDNGDVNGKATNSSVALNGGESDIAAQEDKVFSTENSVVPVVADDQASENSTESFHWGYGGQECYKYQASYSETYDSPNFDYSKRLDLRYEKCRPVYSTQHHRVYYRYMGRVWHPEHRCFYNRYYRSELAYWHGNDYTYYPYQNTYHGYQPGM